MKLALVILLIISFSLGPVLPLGKGYAFYSQMPAFLCEIGLQFYNQGRYDEALHEFKKALLVQPDYEPALKFIQMIEGSRREGRGVAEVAPSYYKPASASPVDVINEYLDMMELQKEIIRERQGIQKLTSPVITQAQEKAAPPAVIALDETFSNVHQPIEIEKYKSIILRGSNIQRYLVTQPDILNVEKIGSNEILLTGKNIGYTYLHVWDDPGRKTIELLCVLPKPKGPTLEEEMRLEEERANAFKLRYSLEWHNFYQGKDFGNLERQYYSYDHNLSLTGATPYGNIDSLAIVRTLNAVSTAKTTDLRYFTLGLTEGKLWNFRDFSLRGFDFYPAIDNYAFGGGTTLRGAMIESPAFNKKLNYVGFWGREGGGKFGPLSPGLQELKESYISGARFNLAPKEDLNYDVSVFHGYGSERGVDLPDYAYDASVNWHMGDWRHRYEAAYEINNLAHLLSGNYSRPRANFTYELRDISKEFINIVGNVWHRGEFGSLFTLNLDPSDNWNIFNRLDIYRDRQFPAQDNEERFNQDYDLYSRYTIDPTTSARINYSFQNDLGKVAQTRYLSAGTGISKSFNLIRTVNSNLDYRHSQMRDYSNPSNSYTNESIVMGARFSIIGQLYFFANQQWNWLEEKSAGNRFFPRYFESGLDLSSQIPKTQFYENLRFIYHDEENTESPFSFLSGEDYIEGYAEISYRPTSDTESYLSTRVRNVWADNPNITKRIEADFNAGFRYLWDTGIHWESVGNIEGYIFRDLNSDGLRQKDEPPVEGIKVWLGKNKSAVSDLFGYYKFKGVKGKKAFILVDAQSLPSGFVLTVPQRQEVVIEQYRAGRADFGIISRSEISGMVFYDANDNQEYDPGETGFKNVKLILEDGKEILSGGDGRYSFRNVLTGVHKIMLDLNTVPSEYLPKVPITKEFTLFEGVNYIHNLPLKKASK